LKTFQNPESSSKNYREFGKIRIYFLDIVIIVSNEARPRLKKPQFILRQNYFS